MTNQNCSQIIENFPIGFIYLKTFYNEENKPIDFVVTGVNNEFEQLFNIDRKKIINKRLSETEKITPFSQSEFIPKLLKLDESSDKFVYNKYNLKLNKWLKISVYHANKDEVAIFFSDITQSIQPFNDASILFNIASDLFAISDLSGQYLQVNQIWSNAYGYSISEVEHCYMWDFVPADEYTTIKNTLTQIVNANENINYTARLRHKNGNVSYIEWSSQRQGNRIYSVGRDVTERIYREEEIEYLSFHDVLTGLHNRRFLEEEMKRLNTHRNLPISLIMCDVNRLKLINDVFGHEKGDELIKYAANTIRESCRPEDLVARWGGDEFIVFLPKTSYEDAIKITDRIKENSKKYDINSLELSIACGVSTKEDDYYGLQDLLRNSEDAMYREKSVESSRNRKDMVGIIAQALFEKSPQEEAHAKRVSMLCHYLAVALKCSKDDVRKAEVAGLFHDIGKVAISSDILLKNSELDDKEWKIIKQHTEIGSKVVGDASEFKEIGKAILHHHERYDGNGYPSGMKWDEIPLISRIIALAEAFDSIHQRNDSHNNDTISDIINEIRRNKSTQFDPFITEVFIKDVIEKLYIRK